MKKKILSIFMAALMIVLMHPMQAFASEELVYISISDDGKYVSSEIDGTLMAYLPVPISEIENIHLSDYDLEDFAIDNNADGKEDITVLHLYLFIHEAFYPEGAEPLAGRASGSPGSIFFTWFWGHDCNLNYYVNGEYPLADVGWGSTADIIEVKPGDFVDIMMFTSWGFYGDSGAGFHNFFDENRIIHEMKAKPGEEVTFELKRGYGNVSAGGATEYVPVGDVPVYYSKTAVYAEDAQTVYADSEGKVSVTFPEEGKWYIWMDGQKGVDMDPENIVSSPAYLEISVEAEKNAAFGDVNKDGKINVLDANIVRRYAAKLIELDAEQLSAADVDGNKKINILDANLIRRYAAKLIDKFPAEA